jgi:hypothetical protein
VRDDRSPIRAASIDVVLALGSINYGNQQVIIDQLQTVADWLTDNGTLIMRGNPGMATGPGLTFFPWSVENIDPIGTSARLRRDHPIRYDTYVNKKGNAEPRLVWRYRKA